ncbi:TIGR02680 family protein [Saccharopolyspora shandongensis]|uniref:TIGR02680 family protein n=1 Tax=Saccharopolyspora shandongensis TaxID=418495 RepID=UPI0033EFD4FF
MTRELPEPAVQRWQPLRAGLIDMFYYDSEEFWFRDGRLLLRGNNGTGKSKVLALTLPFLLDGDLSPHRVEPDADPKKRMEWNLLLGGEHPHPERLGYTWLEFGRVDEQGAPVFRTIGCGLKAVSGKGIARHWYFVTSKRIGDDLALVDATGTALSRDRLIDALDEQGTVYDRARDYRRAVDETFFGFGEQRYSALVDLLIQLRQPQLSKRPSEQALSNALTEALPTLDQAVIADVAEAFRSLEEDRDALAAMVEARDAAQSFLDHYRRYACIAARRRAAQPRLAQSNYERVRSDLSAAEAEFTRAEEELTAIRLKLTELTTVRKRLQARDEALRASPEMRSARELELAGQHARRLAEEAKRIIGERDRAVGRLATQRDRHQAAMRRLSAARETLTGVRRSGVDVADRARIAVEHTEDIDRPLDEQPELAVLRRTAEQLAVRQQRAIKHVTGLVQAVEDSVQALAAARRRVSELDAEAADLADRRVEAGNEVRENGVQLVSAVREHLENATELRLADLAAVMAELELWVETLAGPNPAATAVSAAGHAAAGDLAAAAADLEAQERAGRQRRTELTDEIERLESGEDSAPPVPHTRDHAAREGRPGAPLWRLVDFAENVDEARRAGLEAALEAAGILDAWVTPGGELYAADTSDVLLRAGEPASVNLSAVLEPAVDRADPHADAVSDATVLSVLASIGLGEHGQTWVGPDGRFQIGVLAGAWHKPVATYIGRGAREAARRARLGELREELARVQAELAAVAGARRRLEERKAKLAEEVAAVPSDARLRQAHAQLASLDQEHQRLTARQARAEQDVVAATAVEEAARTALDEGALDAGLPAERAKLSEVDSALGEYRVVIAGLWPAVEAVREAGRHGGETAVELEHAESTVEELTDRAGTAEHEAAAADEHHRTLSSTVGAAVAELQRQLAEVAKAVQDNESDQQQAGLDRDRAIEQRGAAKGRREELGEQLKTAAEERATAAESFRRFAGTGLLAVALPELEIPDPAEKWAPDPTVRLARRVNEELADVADDDNAWERAQHRVNNEHKTLHDTLSRHGNRASADLREDGVVVEIEFQGRPASVPELTEALATEVADRERLLNERERETLENHLVNEVASTLQELISAAEAQVALMNQELAARPTSTGMQLRLLWRPKEDGPAGLAVARERLLRQTSDAWSEDDRAAVGGFLQAQIAEVRARNTTGTWLEHLTEALDYRKWNRFVIQRHQHGQWRSASGPASGGERVLAASVPLFAAASSHYASAGNPHAPRLVTLDEAFAGVDDNARAKYLGLLAAFDLDVVLTSEREWGCYPEVPGLRIAQLSRVDGVPAVLVTNWEWDGSTRTRVSPQDSPAQQGLWGQSVGS